jgi:hypothetical protein
MLYSEIIAVYCAVQTWPLYMNQVNNCLTITSNYRQFMPFPLPPHTTVQSVTRSTVLVYRTAQFVCCTASHRHIIMTKTVQLYGRCNVAA